VGISFVACYNYIKEFAPESMLINLTYIPVLMVSLGHVSSFVVTYFLGYTRAFLFGDRGPALVYGSITISILLPILRLILTYAFVKETPYYWMMKGDTQKFQDVTSEIYHDFAIPSFKATQEEKFSKFKECKNPFSQYAKVIAHKPNLKLVAIGAYLFLCQQICGSNVINLYSHKILHKSTTHENSALITVGMSIFELCSIGFSLLLTQYIGVKTLWLFGNFCVPCMLVFVGLGAFMENVFISATAICIFLFVYSLTIGPLCFVIVNHIVPPEVMNIPMATHKIMMLLMALFFPPMFLRIGVDNVIYIEAVVITMIGVMNIWVIKETKGMGREEAMSKYLGGSGEEKLAGGNELISIGKSNKSVGGTMAVEQSIEGSVSARVISLRKTLAKL
jgi:hypothetical protein